MERKWALDIFIKELQKNWDRLIEEAEKEIGEENWITYRLAILKFALKIMPPSHFQSFKAFKREIKQCLK